MSKRYIPCWNCREPVIYNDKYSELKAEGKDTKGVPKFLNYPDESPHDCRKSSKSIKDSTDNPRNKLFWARIDIEKALESYLSSHIVEQMLKGENISLTNIEDHFVINKYKNMKLKDEETGFTLTIRNLIIENLNTRVIDDKNFVKYIFTLKENNMIGLEKWNNPKGIKTSRNRKGILPGIFDADWFNDPRKVEDFYKRWDLPYKKE